MAPILGVEHETGRNQDGFYTTHRSFWCWTCWAPVSPWLSISLSIGFYVYPHFSHLFDQVPLPLNTYFSMRDLVFCHILLSLDNSPSSSIESRWHVQLFFLLSDGETGIEEVLIQKHHSQKIWISYFQENSAEVLPRKSMFRKLLWREREDSRGHWDASSKRKWGERRETSNRRQLRIIKHSQKWGTKNLKKMTLQ